jgi:hypothetical protein
MSSEAPNVCPQCGAIPAESGDESLTPAERFLKHAERVHGVGLNEARKLAGREPKTEAEMRAVSADDDDEKTAPFTRNS